MFDLERRITMKPGVSCCFCNKRRSRANISIALMNHDWSDWRSPEVMESYFVPMIKGATKVETIGLE